jgi:hypothetical protein
MANTYTWDFPTLDVHNTAQNGHDDVISTIHWRVTAVSDSEQDADGNYLTASYVWHSRSYNARSR